MLALLSATAVTSGALPLNFFTAPRPALGGPDVPLEDIVGRIGGSRAALPLQQWQDLSSALDDLDHDRARQQMRALVPQGSAGLRELERTWEEVKALAAAPMPHVCREVLTRFLAPPVVSRGLLSVPAPTFALASQLSQSSPSSAGPTVESWARLTSVLTRPTPESALGHLDELLAINVPHQNSPEVTSTPLEKLITTLQHAVYLPLSAGAVEATAQVTHHDFALAIETTVTSGAVTLLLAATANLSARLLSARTPPDE